MKKPNLSFERDSPEAGEPLNFTLGLKGKFVPGEDNVQAAMQAKDPVALAQLLLDESHEQHEDIVFELGLIGDPRAVDAIARAVLIPFEYLVRWQNLHEFQRKCAYALARIGTEESHSVLQQLAAQPDPYLKKYGEEGLQHWLLKCNA